MPIWQFTRCICLPQKKVLYWVKLLCFSKINPFLFVYHSITDLPPCLGCTTTGHVCPLFFAKAADKNYQCLRR
ncbi:hypothetical protein C7N43_34340 [Sphingobacteriales bacterium UPWRP_1]|nr:hypothetical protein C7N43_34340 [Sphingobacteriales bacterium UPWRP_1]